MQIMAEILIWKLLLFFFCEVVFVVDFYVK